MKMEPGSSDFRRRQEWSWQRQAFHYINLIPELNYASRFYSKMLKKVRLYPAIRKPDDTLEAITQGPPVELLDQIQDPGGGRSQLLGMYGRLMFISGDGYLFGRNLGQNQERWSFVSAEEIELEKEANGGGKIIWRPEQDQEGQTFQAGTEAVAYRMWTPSPQRSGEPDSPMRACQEIAEELIILTRAVRATAVSRMVNGILKVPAEISFGADDGPDDDPEENPLLRDIIDHITGVIENAGSPEAASPFLAEGANEFLANLEWIKTHDPATDYMEQALRTEAVKRLSLGLDMPPEVLMGLANANHWVGRQIMLEQWRSHGSPVAEQFADDLSEAYLRPALAAIDTDTGSPVYENWRQVVVAVDDSQVVVSPDRSQDADQAFDRGALGWGPYRKMKGIEEDAAPSLTEQKIYLAVKLRNPAFLKGTPFEVPDAPPRTPPGPTPLPSSGLPADETPPDPNSNGVSRPENPAIHSILGAAEMALLRCREIAGSRIRSRYGGEIMQVIDGHPNTRVAEIVGSERLEALGCPDPLQLVSSGTDSFVLLLLQRGIHRSQADDLARTLRVHAAKTLCDSTPDLSPGFVAQVEKLKEVVHA